MIEDTPDQYKVRMQKHAEKTLAAVAQTAQASGVTCETVQVEHEHAYHAIIDTAGSNNCDLIVMASPPSMADVPFAYVSLDVLREQDGR